MCSDVCITEKGIKMSKLSTDIENQTKVIQRYSICFTQNNHTLCTYLCE